MKARKPSPLLILVGLTGVGKSSLLKALRARLPELEVLPERRELTDRVVIPEVLKREGRPQRPVRDRLERFRLTARYRDTHPGGMAHALLEVLRTQRTNGQLRVFENLRGLAEVRFAAERLPDARFAILDAPDPVRVMRLLGRRDPFDLGSGSNPGSSLNPDSGSDLGSGAAPSGPGAANGARARTLLDALSRVPEVEQVFSRRALERLSALPDLDPTVTAGEVVNAVTIVVSESRHYSMAEVLDYASTNDERRFLVVDSGALSVEDAAERIRRWLNAPGR